MTRRTRRQWGAWILAGAMAISSAVPAMAAEDREKIDKVTLNFSYDKEPASGDEIGDIRVSTNSDQFSVDYVEYTNGGDTWTVGDVPEVRVELVAESGCYFGYESKSHFDLNGGGAEFKDADRQDDNTYMVLFVELDRIGGKLSAPQNLEWDGPTASWDHLDGAKTYEVKLYRGSSLVTTVETTSNYYNFAGSINREGDYTFRVRGISDYNDRSGEWSEDSDDYYVDEDEAVYSGTGAWQHDGIGWWYAYTGGGYPANCWKVINGAWYYFDRSGYMLTGWQFIDGDWYYLAPSGAMTTGWQLVNNVWYYMDGSGAMQTGWNYINGAWYYMDASGAMYANTMTPDGHYVDATGARVY